MSKNKQQCFDFVHEALVLILPPLLTSLTLGRHPRCRRSQEQGPASWQKLCSASAEASHKEAPFWVGKPYKHRTRWVSLGVSSLRNASGLEPCQSHGHTIPFNKYQCKSEIRVRVLFLYP